MPQNPYEETLLEGQKVNPYRETLRLQQSSSETMLRQAVKTSTARDPKRQAEILKLSERTGLPPDLIDRNFDSIRSRAEITDTPYSEMLRESPKTAEWLTDPDNATIAKDDQRQLGKLEWLLTKGRDYFGAAASGVLGHGGIGSFLSGAGELYDVSIRALETPLAAILPEEALSFLHKPVVPWWGDPAQILKRPGEELKATGEQLAPPPERQTLGTDIAAGIGQLGGQIVIALAGGPVASAASLYAQGADIMAGKIRHDPASQAEKDIATVAGAGVTGLTERFGLNLILDRVPPAIRSAALRKLTDVVAAGGIEAGQEFSEALLQDVGRRLLTNEQAPLLENVTREMAAAGGAGAAVRAILTTALGVRVRNQARVQEQFFQALGDGVTTSKTFERLPAKLQEFITNATKNGPIENLFIPVGAWTTYWQSQNVDPGQAAENVGIDREAFASAVATGEDLAVPTAAYATQIAPEHGTAFIKEIRLAPEEMNAREAEEFEAILTKESAAPDISTKEDSAAKVREDVIGQMLNTGFDRTAVEAYASLYESAFRALGERSGVDPFELYQQYGLKVTRPIPEVLRSVGKIDAMDPIIDRLRTGDVPRGTEVFGPSLLDFLREKGGVIDEGGELAALEVDASLKVFQKKLVQAKGLPLDRAREMAAESGYLPFESSVAEFLDVIEKEVRGTPVYSQQNADPAKLETMTVLQQLEDYLKAVGVDLAKATNEEIKQILNQAAIDPGTGQVLNQAGTGSIATLTGKELGDYTDLRDLRRKAKEYYFRELRDGIGAIERQDLGVIRFTGSGWDKVKGSSADETTLKLLAAVSRIIEKGRFTHSEDAPPKRLKQDGIVRFHYLRGLVDLEGKPYDAGVTISEDDKGNKFFNVLSDPDAALARKKARGLPPSQTEGPGPSSEDGETTLNQSVAPGDGNINLTIFGQGGQRGSIRFGKDRQFSIEALESADLSTFLHESGHFYLEVFGDVVEDLLARSGDLTPEQQRMVEDYGAALKWMGVADRSMIRDEQHEQWARGFEAYLLEGKAPSPELRSLFARFRAWLTSIYRSLRQLNVKLTPEVRTVMDRLLATDEEITRAETDAGIEAMFTDALAAGMSEAEFAAYRATVQAASDRAKDNLQRKLMSELQQRRSEKWQIDRERVRAQVAAEVHGQREYIALAFLQRGKLPDGSALPEGVQAVKLSKEALLKQYGKAFLKRLPKPYVYSREGGITPDTAAELFGYSSGDELVRAMINARPMKELIEAETDSRMRDQYGDLLLDGSLPDEAKAAVMGEGRSEVLQAELRALAKKRREIAPFLKAGEARTREGVAMLASVPPINVVRQWAQARVAGMQLRHLKPGQFWMAARRYGQAALDAAAKDDFNTALLEKRRELLNVELYRAVVEAQDRVEGVYDYMRSFSEKSKRERLAKAGGEYLERIDDILGRFEFARVPLKALEQRKSLDAWVADQEKLGLPVDIPAELLNEAKRTNYRDLTFEQLIGLNDSVKQIEHLARLKNKLLRAKEKRELDEAVTTLDASIRANKPSRPKQIEARLPAAESARSVGWFFASHRKLSSIVREMDGLQDGGPMWDLIMRPINEAGDAESTMNAAATEKLAEIFGAYKGETSGLYQKTFIPGANVSLTKTGRLMVALNWGNLGNRQRLMAGHGFNESQIQSILDTLDERDWTFVQNVWDFIDSYWGEIAAKEKRVRGVAPEKVGPAPVPTRFGEFRGGYFPLKYEDRLSAKAASNLDADFSEIVNQASYVKATTRRGHTKERLQKVELPVRLDFGVIFEHTQQVIHDLTHHEMLLDVSRILGHKTVQAAIYETSGDVVYREIKHTLLDIAFGDAPAITSFEKGMNWLRQGSTIAGLGWNVSTALLQPLGLAQSAVRIGPKWVAKGLSRWLRDAASMENTVAWIAAKSALMAQRSKTHLREINEIRNKAGLNTGKLAGWMDDFLQTTTLGAVDRQAVVDSFFWMITRMQLVADVPTWLGAYEKAMASGEEESRAIALADQAVLDSQGGGQVKDLAGVQRGSPMFKLWTNFYSYFNTTYNLTVESVRRTNPKKPLEVGRMTVDLLMLYAVPASMGLFLREALRGDDDDEEGLAEALIRENLSYLFGMMVGLRELSSTISGFYGYEGPAGTRFFSSASRFIQQAGQGELDAALWRAFNDAAGVLFHYPAGQVRRTVEGAIALMEDRTKNPGVLVAGAPRK